MTDLKKFKIFEKNILNQNNYCHSNDEFIDNNIKILNDKGKKHFSKHLKSFDGIYIVFTFLFSFSIFLAYLSIDIRNNFLNKKKIFANEKIKSFIDLFMGFVTVNKIYFKNVYEMTLENNKDLEILKKIPFDDFIYDSQFFFVMSNEYMNKTLSLYNFDYFSKIKTNIFEWDSKVIFEKINSMKTNDIYVKYFDFNIFDKDVNYLNYFNFYQSFFYFLSLFGLFGFLVIILYLFLKINLKVYLSYLKNFMFIMIIIFFKIEVKFLYEFLLYKRFVLIYYFSHQFFIFIEILSNILFSFYLKFSQKDYIIGYLIGELIYFIILIISSSKENINIIEIYFTKNLDVLLRLLLLIFLHFGFKLKKTSKLNNDDIKLLNKSLFDFVDNLNDEYVSFNSKFEILANKKINHIITNINNMHNSSNENYFKKNYKQVYLMKNLLKYYFFNIKFTNDLPIEIKNIIEEIKNFLNFIDNENSYKCFLNSSKLRKNKSYKSFTEKKTGSNFFNSRIKYNFSNDFYDSEENKDNFKQLKTKNIFKSNIFKNPYDSDNKLKTISSKNYCNGHKINECEIKDFYIQVIDYFRYLLDDFIQILRSVSKQSLNSDCLKIQNGNVFDYINIKNSSLAKAGFEINKTETAFLNEQKDQFYEKEYNKIKGLNNEFIFIGIKLKEENFPNKNSENSDHNHIYIRYNNFSNKLEILSKNIDDGIENSNNFIINNDKIRDLFKNSLLKICHEVRNPLLNILEMTKNIKSKYSSVKKLKTSTSFSNSNDINYKECEEFSNENSFRINTNISKLNFPKVSFKNNYTECKMNSQKNSNFNQDIIIYTNSDLRKEHNFFSNPVNIKNINNQNEEINFSHIGNNLSESNIENGLYIRKINPPENKQMINTKLKKFAYHNSTKTTNKPSRMNFNGKEYKFSNYKLKDIDSNRYSQRIKPSNKNIKKIEISNLEILKTLKKIKFLCNLVNSNLFEIENITNLVNINDISQYIENLKIKSKENLFEVNLQKEIDCLSNIINIKISLFNPYLKFTYSISEDVPNKLLIDFETIKKMLFMIINNSVKFTKNGEINLKISIYKNYLLFKLIDDGIGIKLEDQSFIGDLFYKGKSNTDDYGLGIGFFLFKLYLIVLDGLYELNSIQGNGTQITFLIPMKSDNNKSEYKLFLNNQSLENPSLHFLENSSLGKIKYTMSWGNGNFSNLNSKYWLSQSLNDFNFNLNNKLSNIQFPYKKMTKKFTTALENQNIGNFRLKSKFNQNNVLFREKKYSNGKNLNTKLDYLVKFPQLKRVKSLNNYKNSFSQNHTISRKNSNLDEIGKNITIKNEEKNLKKNKILSNIIPERPLEVSYDKKTEKINFDINLSKSKILKKMTNDDKFTNISNIDMNIYKNSRLLSKKISDYKISPIFSNEDYRNVSATNLNILNKSSENFTKFLKDNRTVINYEPENIYNINYFDVGGNLPFNDKCSSENKVSNFSKTIKKNVSKLRILIVDDEELIRKSNMNFCIKYFKKYYFKNNYEVIVEECSDGIEALYKIFLSFSKGFKYNFIITDETMNFMKGSFMARIIRLFIEQNVFYRVVLGLMTSYEKSSIASEVAQDFDVLGTKPISKYFFDRLMDKFEEYRM